MGLDRARGRGRGLEVAEPPLSVLSAANETVGRGYYAPTTLSAVDAELATANIKNGITVFGFAGDADVRDISDATAIAAEVIEGETFYAVSGGIRTGTMPIVALSPDNSNYPEGYHAGEVGGLVDVDAQLVTGSIKFGITIFGVAGHTNVRDVSDANAAVGDVKDPKTFYSVTGPRKTGTMPTVALDPALNEYPAGYHAGEASLTAVDAHLAAGNIKDGVVIFGITGTLVATLAEDIIATALTTNTVTSSGTYYRWNSDAIATGTDLDLASITQNYDTNSMAVGSGFIVGGATSADMMKLRLYMDGVNVAESGYIGRQSVTEYPVMVIGTRALSGSKIVKIAIHNYHTGDQALYLGATTNGQIAPAGVAAGSIKVA